MRLYFLDIFSFIPVLLYSSGEEANLIYETFLIKNGYQTAGMQDPRWVQSVKKWKSCTSKKENEKKARYREAVSWDSSAYESLCVVRSQT